MTDIEPRYRWEMEVRRNRAMEHAFLTLAKAVGFKDSRGGVGGGKPDYEPEIDEIRQACAAIQAEWSPREELVRRVGTNRRIACFVRLVTVRT